MTTTTGRLAAAAGLGLAVSAATADTGVFHAIDPTTTFQHTCEDPAGLPLVIDLDAEGYAPGDTIRIQSTGDFAFVQGGPEDGEAALGVFSSDGVVLADRSLVDRVPGAIPSDAPDFSTDDPNAPDRCPDATTEILEDFLCDGTPITVPDRGDGRAAFLIVSAFDIYYSDNEDQDSDFGVVLSRERVLSEPCFFGPSGYLCFDDSPWFNASISLETLEDGVLSYPAVTSNGDIRGPDSGADSVDCDDGVIDGDGRDGRSFKVSRANEGMWFEFDRSLLGGRYPQRVGVVWTDGAEGPNNTIFFQAFDQDDDLIGEITGNHADGNNIGTTAEDRFYGVEYLAGVRRVRIYTNRSDEGIETDHLQFDFITCSIADLAEPFGTLDLSDINAFTAGFVAQDPIADLNADGLFDLADIGMFIDGFLAGCP